MDELGRVAAAGAPDDEPPYVNTLCRFSMRDYIAGIGTPFEPLTEAEEEVRGWLIRDDAEFAPSVQRNGEGGTTGEETAAGETAPENYEDDYEKTVSVESEDHQDDDDKTISAESEDHEDDDNKTISAESSDAGVGMGDI